ncbi:glycosyltransferase [Halobaculum gomorrense]|uniref:Glycosyltransferase involved in cell wall bisynthesis n=1 Tax=Halobaculum gomorrense TaxID=43928 RepID=A0A1M5R9U6_9EURY|nr:glycosyltransferase [Halobaculum gomorrense]SHH22839.1 Glycosyltransferase involved in cell wall bisynthesis [Halobaculum gomorrense]
MQTVAAFTDTYLPTVNGVTYTLESWRTEWQARGGRMDVVFPGAPGHDPGDGEYTTRSVGFPFYDGFRMGLPGVPDAVRDADVVHAHTPFALGLSGWFLAHRIDAPLVASYHTPTAEYADYLAAGPAATVVEGAARRYERRYMNAATAVVVPSEPAGEHLSDIGVTTPVEVVPNGVNTDFFTRPDDDALADFRAEHDLPDPADAPLVGYTGRHGFEKELTEIPPAVATADAEATLVFGGDGPARDAVERACEAAGVDARFLGFLPREQLPALYATLDAFLFPSPVETQGLVALEANACGTPVVGVDAGALADTVVDGETGHHYPRGDTGAFADAIDRTLAERESLSAACLDRREDTSVEHAVDRLEQVYGAVLS